MARSTSGQERHRDPRTFRHPVAYRNRVVRRLPLWLWSTLGLIVAVSLFGVAHEGQVRQRDAQLLETSELVDAIRVSPQVAGFVDGEGQAQLVRVRRLPRIGAGTGSTERSLPTWSALHVAPDDDGRPQAYWTDEFRVFPAWVIPAGTTAGALAAAAALAALVAELRSLRRLRREGIGRTEANIALLLYPADVQAEPDPKRRIEAVLADRSLPPQLEPWIPPVDDDVHGREARPPVAAVRSARWVWLVVLIGIGFAAIAFGAVVQGFGGPRDHIITVGLVVLATVVAVMVSTPRFHRLSVSADGILTHRWILSRRRFDLRRLQQVIARDWSAGPPHHPGERRRMAPGSLAMRFDDGRGLVVRMNLYRDARSLGEVLRFWVIRAGAEITGDLAYALRLTADPRDEPPAPARRVTDDRWLRRPARRVRSGLGSVVVVFGFLLGGAAVLAAVPLAHLLWDNPDEGDPRPALVDPCSAFDGLAASDVEPLGEVSGDLFSGCGGQLDGEWIRARTSPSAAAYDGVLTNPRDDIGFAEVVDDQLLRDLGALQVHVLVGDDDVWLMARTRAGTVQVAGSRASESLLLMLEEQLRADNVRPIDSDVEIEELHATVQQWGRESPQVLDASVVAAAIEGTVLEGRIATGD